MILREALHAIPRRLKRPLILGMILAFTALGVGYIPVMAMVIRTAPPPHPYLPPVTFGLILNTLLSVVHTFGLSALPWQWTGDDRRLAPPGRGLLQSVLFSASFSALVMLMRLDMLKQTYAHLPHVPDFPEAFRVVAFGLSMIVGLFFSCLIGFIVAFWEARQAEKAEALKRAEEARWALLKAQMSPHVLLNSLNGLAELVREDSQAAVKGMRDLAEIYHQLLTLGDAPRTPLGQERHLLERYLAVEQLRLGKQLTVQWHWDESLDALPVVPLLLQPLVENALKHGVAADPNGGVLRIETRAEKDRLHLAVANTGRALTPTAEPGGGVGLRNLKARLGLAYGNRAQFQLLREDEWTRAELSLPRETP